MSLLSLHSDKEYVFISLLSYNDYVEVTTLSLSLCSDRVDVVATIPSLSLHIDSDNVDIDIDDVFTVTLCLLLYSDRVLSSLYSNNSLYSDIGDVVE